MYFNTLHNVKAWDSKYSPTSGDIYNQKPTKEYAKAKFKIIKCILNIFQIYTAALCANTQISYQCIRNSQFGGYPYEISMVYHNPITFVCPYYTI